MVQPRESLGSAELVLVAADDSGLRDALAFMLLAEGYAVTVVRTAQAVLALEQPDRPRCVVVDDTVAAPGLAVIGELRSAGFFAPALLLSGRPSRAISVAAALLNAQVIEKPLAPAQFLAALRTALAG